MKLLCNIKHNWKYYGFLTLQRKCIRCHKCQYLYVDGITIFDEWIDLVKERSE